MSDSERKTKASVTVLWAEATLDNELVRVKASGAARVIIGEFDIHVPGGFASVDEVISGYKRMLDEQSLAYAKFVDEPVEPTVCDDNCGLIEITDEELDELIREYEKDRGQVISMITRKSL